MSTPKHDEGEQSIALDKAIASASSSPKRLGKNSTVEQLRQALRDLDLDDHGKKETLLRCVGLLLFLYTLERQVI